MSVRVDSFTGGKTLGTQALHRKTRFATLLWVNCVDTGVKLDTTPWDFRKGRRNSVVLCCADQTHDSFLFVHLLTKSFTNRPIPFNDFTLSYRPTYDVLYICKASVYPLFFLARRLSSLTQRLFFYSSGICLFIFP